MVVTMSGVIATIRIMRVLVVLVMFVFMLVVQDFMQVSMGMVLSQVKPYAQAH